MAFIVSSLVVQADNLVAGSSDDSFWLAGSTGLMTIAAREYVYLGNDKASELDWDADDVILYTVTAGADLGKDWYTKAKVGFGGDGHLVDYDWVPGFALDQSKDGWSDHSIHPDTNLEYYFSGAFEVGKTVFADETSRVGFGGGFKYTELRWEAFGGSYIYSDGGFRNDIDEIPAGIRGISYEQRVPTLFLGIDGSTSIGRLTVSGAVKGRLTAGINDIDNHWLTEARVFGDMRAGPVLMVNAAIAYQRTESALIYLSGNI